MLDTITMATQLKGEYKEAFERADMYGTFQSGDDENINDDKMMNLYDLLLQAQADGVPASKIVGDDIEEFCKDYFRVEKEKRWVSVANAIYRICWWAFILGLLEVFLPEEEGVQVLQLTVNIAPILLGFVMGVVFIPLPFALLKKTIFKSKKIKPIVMYLTMILLFVISVIGTLALQMHMGWEYRIKVGTLLLLTGVYLAVYIVVRAVYRYRDHGSFGKFSKEETLRRKEEKKEKADFNKDLGKRNVAQTAKDMKVRYKRLNRKHQKKYNEPLSLEKFGEKLRKEKADIHKHKIFYIILDVVLLLGPVVAGFWNDGFAGMLDGIMYAVMMCVVFFFIYRFQCWTDKIVDEAMDEQLIVIDLCLKHGLDLDSVGTLEGTAELEEAIEVSE